MFTDPLPAVAALKTWPDLLIDTLGYPVDSDYVERFWLPSLGPTSLLMLRRLSATAVAGRPTIDLAALGACLGISPSLSASRPIAQTLARLARFELVALEDATLKVRTAVGPLNRRQVMRLPAFLAHQHDNLMKQGLAV